MGAGTPPAGDDVQALAGAPARAPAGLDYEDTPVGPLPIGPAGDAALAGAAVRAARDGRRRSADVLDLGAASRAAVARRLLPALAAVSAALAVLLWRRSGRRG
jgi:hypothetical protein